MSGQDDSVVLARLDANVSNLMTQMAEIKAAQANLVSRERLEIEMKAREADIIRVNATVAGIQVDSREVRMGGFARIDALEKAQARAQGALWMLSGVGTALLAILAVLVGHLYIK